MPTKPAKAAPAATDPTAVLLRQLAANDKPHIRRWAELLLASPDAVPTHLPGREPGPPAAAEVNGS
jgi:hypothetical protein